MDTNSSRSIGISSELSINGKSNGIKQMESAGEVHFDSGQKNGPRRHILQKFVYMSSACSIVVLTYATTHSPWLVPYYYAVILPILLIARAVSYTKLKWQYFLLDFCYFVNTMAFVFIWACPWQSELNAVVFALSNGPLPWASFIFRNSLVLHSFDKMTSVFIHFIPPLLSFCIRWFPMETSLYWYTPFNQEYNVEIDYLFIWLVAVPIGCHCFHILIYTVLLHCVCKPSEEYSHSYAYLVEGGWMKCMFNCCGRGKSLCMYIFLQTVFAVVSCLLTPLFYVFYEAHLVLLCIIFITVNFNASTFYMKFLTERGINDVN